MSPAKRTETTLIEAVRLAGAGECPPRLAAALRYALFPGGARIRPEVCHAVAASCGDDEPTVTNAAAASIELMHCASLVHDDLPCFDDAEIRRGKPSLHKAFGQRLAVLVGDSLIVLAFETLARGAAHRPDRLSALLGILGRAAGAPAGIAAGQAWECETRIDLAQYHQAKTGALFAAATCAGAAAAGASAEDWRTLGERLGQAYQVADDIRDVAARPEEIGKPTGQDDLLDRPSIAREMGLRRAVQHLDSLVEDAIRAIPACPGRGALESLMTGRARQFLPDRLWRMAA